MNEFKREFDNYCDSIIEDYHCKYRSWILTCKGFIFKLLNFKKIKNLKDVIAYIDKKYTNLSKRKKEKLTVVETNIWSISKLLCDNFKEYKANQNMNLNSDEIEDMNWNKINKFMNNKI